MRLDYLQKAQRPKNVVGSASSKFPTEHTELNCFKMKCSVFAATLVAFVNLCDAVPTPSTYALHEKRSSMPWLWSRSNRVEREAILPIRIGLTQNSLENAEMHLMDV
jgi:hypothetical protein